MSDIGQQLPALIGVVIGAMASYLAGATTERARWRRERSSRWDEKRAQAYADYGYAIKNVYVQCMRAASIRFQDADGDSREYDEAFAEIDRMTDERTAKWESVLLLGNPDTVAAARSWHRRVWQVERFARGERTDMDNWRALLDEVMADRDSFYKAAREDLGIASGDLPPGGPWDASVAAAPGSVAAT
jgi:hypothetical protein